MTLEAAIQENTAVMRELINRLGVAGPFTGSVAAGGEVKKPIAETVSSGPGVQPPVTVPTASVQGTVDYETHVKPAALALASKVGKGREKLLEVLATFGLVSVKEAKPEQYSALVVEFNKALVS